MNRLADEKSPYLLQHARNPVDWYPWGEEAFAAARRDHKPVFLSIGYSTCHWCHVMEKESFEDEEVARLLNEAFICVKVDREERPDLDHYYLTVCQLLTGSAGWPLTVMLTPDRDPFFASTYIPRESRHGRMGLLELIPRVLAAWGSDPGGIVSSAARTRDVLTRLSSPPDGPEEAGLELSEKAYRELKASFDDKWGGFGRPPKFPVPHRLIFLLRHGRGTGRRKAEHMAVRTLEAMSRGGIFDQVGGGFHRYATDSEWFVPHFEKMLYDQALLALAYAEGWQATRRPEFKATAEDITAYMLRDLRQPEGGFASAEDADSEGEEGKYYLWTREQFLKALEPGEVETALARFHVSAEGNFAEPGKARDGRNILHLGRSGEGTVSGREAGGGGSGERSAAVRARLLKERRRRVPPLKDTKILADWTGLAVAALSVCGRALDNVSYLREAESAADFLRARLTRPDGGLFHRFKDGEAAIPAFLDDYAFIVWGLLELFQSTFRPEDLAEAVRLARRAVEDFWDGERGGFFFTAKGSEDIPVRKKEFADGALPSGNSVMAGNLFFLARLTADPAWEKLFDRLSRVLGAEASSGPASFAHYLGVRELADRPFHEVVIAGRAGAPDTEAFLGVLRREYLPGKAVLLRPEDPGAEALLAVVPRLESYRMIGGRAAAYVCSGFRCQAPTVRPEEMLRLLHSSNAPYQGPGPTSHEN